MAEYDSLVVEEIAATLDRAGFENLSLGLFRVEIPDSFQRKFGECRPLQQSDDTSNVDRYQIRIARRLFDDGSDSDWRDTVRHEVAHAYVFSAFGRSVHPHGDEWKDAARRAGADPTARYEVSGDLVDEDYVLACPNGCFDRGYLQRSRRIKYPWQYACKECETRLVSYDAADVPSALEPGTCYVGSIPWETNDDLGGADTTRTAPYLVACPNGCVEWPYQKRAKRIKNPWLYSCPNCETTLISCDGGDPPTGFEPGTCNVTSIPWTKPRIIHACPNDCFSVGYLNHCEETRDPDQYRCGECDTRTVSYPADQRPSDPTPGTNYTE